jgi:F0F1-type ATP synthase epsilon subunit
MKLENCKDVRDFIKDFIVQINDGSLELKQPGVVIQALNCWLKAYQIEQESEIEKRLSELEKKIQERGNHEREREFELD